MLRLGMFLQERYEIIEQIGSGGMSIVYKAKCHKLNRMVAIKVLKEEFSTDATFVSKFKMEAQAAAGLSHPNIVSVYDVIDEGSIHYIVMEVIEGITLKNYIAKKGRIENKEAIGIAIQVAQGMAAAHDQNIIHRDIKPQNMIISKDGKVKVADFGIARAVSAQTINSNAIGSIHYISPEQARGGYSDVRSDIYSFGITMYEMVTGRVPFEGDNTVAIALSHLEDLIPSPSEYAPDLSPALESIIFKCTEKKPERRYDSATELIGDLRKALLQPDQDFVKRVPELDLSETIAISEPDLKTIQERRRHLSKNRVVKEESDDMNSKFEKLLTGAGIVVAIIIVVVLIFMVSRLTGLFGNGSSNKKEETGNQTEVSLSSKEVLMPDVVGLSEELARAKLEDSTLGMKIIKYEVSEVYEKGVVLYQEVSENTVVDKYSQVNVVVSSGIDKFDLSTMALEGTDAEATKTFLEKKGIVVNLEVQSHESIVKGKVIGYEPEVVKIGEVVTLFVSSGVEETQPAKTVPAIIGNTEEEAIKKITESGFVKGNVTLEYHESVPKGYVINQALSAGSVLEEGGLISFTVSKGVKAVEYKYLASINTTYPLKNIIGPASGTIELNVKIRLKQVVDGKAEYRDLISPVRVTGDTVLPVSFPNIEGAKGVEKGEVEVINADTQEVLYSYPLIFIAVPQS